VLRGVLAAGVRGPAVTLDRYRRTTTLDLSEGGASLAALPLPGDVLGHHRHLVRSCHPMRVVPSSTARMITFRGDDRGR
jgi:hypothetical protein